MEPLKNTFWILLLLPAQLLAQLQFVAKSDKYRVGKDEDFTITLSLNGSGQDLELPPLDDFIVLSGPNKSFSTSIVNNRISQELNFSLVLRPRRIGRAKFGSARIRSAEGTLSSKPLEIEVVAVSPRTADPNNPLRIAADNAFIRAEFSKTKLLLGEPVQLNLVLYVSNQVNIGQPQLEEIPDFPGLYQREVELKELPRGEAIVDGVRYRTFTLSRKMLIPQQAGRLSFKPYVFQLPTEVPTNRRDIFGRRHFERVNQLAQVNVPELLVLEPPMDSRPEGYKGAMGSFGLKSNLSRNQVQPNQSVTLTYELTGKGNIPLVSIPEPELPQELERYDPEFKETISLQGTTYAGKKSMEIVVVPRYPGTYKIPALTIPYFNPATQSYETAQTQSLNLVVAGEGTGEGYPTHQTATNSNSGQVLRELDKDIRYLRSTPNWDHNGLPQWKWAGAMAILGWGSLLMFALYLLLKNAGLGQKTNPRKQRIEKALKTLENAAVNNQENLLQVLENQLRALQLELKLDQPHQLSDQAREAWESIWNQLEKARYMPMAAADANLLRQEAIHWIKTHLA